jgi:hypothetical protein
VCFRLDCPIERAACESRECSMSVQVFAANLLSSRGRGRGRGVGRIEVVECELRNVPQDELQSNANEMESRRIDGKGCAYWPSRSYSKEVGVQFTLCEGQRRERERERETKINDVRDRKL